MKWIKQITYFILMLILMASCSQCSSAQKLQKKPPLMMGQVYYQNWVAGVEGGGSGLNLFIPVKPSSKILLDTVYFRGKSTPLELTPNEELYIGRFKTALNQPRDVILSSDLNEEHINQIPIKNEEIPFDLKDDECVISYKINENRFYYKISNIIQKEPLNYPSAGPN